MLVGQAEAGMASAPSLVGSQLFIGVAFIISRFLPPEPLSEPWSGRRIIAECVAAPFESVQMKLGMLIAVQ
jgi:hypothetical protein